MILSKYEKYEKLTDIALGDILESGIKCVMMDMDSTLLVWHGKEIGEAEKEWCRNLLRNDIVLYIVSNAKKDRTKEIAAQLGIGFIAPAAKPFPFGLIKAARHAKVKMKNCLMVGDQLLTDKVAATLAGVRFALVNPISNVEFGLTKINRRIEKFLFGRDFT